MIAGLGWQDLAALALGALGVLFALWLRRRCGGGHDCRRCAHLPGTRELHRPPPRE